jgi:hypothetical protein
MFVHSGSLFAGCLQIKSTVVNASRGGGAFSPALHQTGPRIPFAFDRPYWLAPFVLVVMIRMAVPPVPIRSLLLFLQLSKGPIRPVFRANVLAIDPVFVFVPIVIVLVVAVVDPVMILIVPMVSQI